MIEKLKTIQTGNENVYEDFTTEPYCTFFCLLGDLKAFVGVLLELWNAI